MLLNVFAYDLGNRTEHIHINFHKTFLSEESSGYVGGQDCHSEGLVQAGRLDSQQLHKVKKKKKQKSNVLHLGQNNSKQQHRLSAG